MSERKQRILQVAIEIIARDGYGKLSMRGLARASGMKLGALQYHFPTWQDMLHALAAYIIQEYRRSFDALETGRGTPDLRETVQFIIDDAPGSALQADRLLPQLWAMALVEPVMEELLDNIYGGYLSILEELLVIAGSRSPRVEALALMSLLEGSTLFLGCERRWAGDANAVRDAVLEFIDAKYGDRD